MAENVRIKKSARPVRATRGGKRRAGTPSVSLTDQAHRAIRSRLIDGAYGPGDLIDLNRIMAELGMSRTPVREALLRLQSEGMVEVIPKTGIRVRPISSEDLREIYQIISGLEVEAAASLAARKPDTATLRPLDEALTAMQAAVDRDDSDAWARADESFHRSLLALGRNARLERLAIAHRDLAQRAHFVALRLIPMEAKRGSIRAHQDLVEALRAGSSARVRSLHLKQRQRGGEMLVDVLIRHGLKVL